MSFERNDEFASVCSAPLASPSGSLLTATLSYCLISNYKNCLNILLIHCPTAFRTIVPLFPIALQCLTILQYSVPLPYCHPILLFRRLMLYCHKILLFGRPAAQLPHNPSVPLSYCHTILLVSNMEAGCCLGSEENAVGMGRQAWPTRKGERLAVNA
jgi:hypothetical protein